MNEDALPRKKKKDWATLILLNSGVPTEVLKLLHSPKAGITFVFTIT